MITHCFTTAVFADVIQVMSGGRIIESCSHDELLNAGRLYSQGWAAQAAAQ